MKLRVNKLLVATLLVSWFIYVVSFLYLIQAVKASYTMGKVEGIKECVDEHNVMRAREHNIRTFEEAGLEYNEEEVMANLRRAWPDKSEKELREVTIWNV